MQVICEPQPEEHESPASPVPVSSEFHRLSQSIGISRRARLVHDDLAGLDSDLIEAERRRLQIYEYLCHVGEAKEWIESLVNMDLGPVCNLEEELRNGILLAHLANHLDKENQKKVFEDRSHLQYRHSENVNIFLNYLQRIKLPEVFYFELTDLYNGKNFPKVIYCIHALASFLHGKGVSTPVKNLVGELEFTADEIKATDLSLNTMGVSVPVFSNISKTIAIELRDNSSENRFEKEARRESVVACAKIPKLFPSSEPKSDSGTQRLKQEQLVNSVIVLQRNHRLKTFIREMKVNGIKHRQNAALVIWTAYKSWKRSRALSEILRNLKLRHGAVLVIERFWRTHKGHLIYNSLVSGKIEPTISNVRSVCSMWGSLMMKAEDNSLDEKRQAIVRLIRDNAKLEADVNDLDTKIYLLIRNRVTLEEVVHSTKKKALKDISESKSTFLGSRSWSERGLSSKTKAATELRDLYGNLFYILQTCPRYLANLMVSVHKVETSALAKKLETIIAVIYGYAQNPREEFLFLSLIKEIIKIEIELYPSFEFIWQGDLSFVRCVLLYSRMVQNTSYIRYVLGPLVKKVIRDTDLDLEVDPVSIYRNLIRDEEISTGDKSSRQYQVSFKSIKNDKEVQKIQKKNMQNLKLYTEEFLNRIVQSVKEMPFGMRYIVVQLKEHLMKNSTKDHVSITKFVGNLLYYRYLNPAIIAPETFGVLDETISVSQRRNLAEIAKTLHQISVCKLFTSTDDALYALNPFIKDSYRKFLTFFDEAAKITSFNAYASDEFAFDIYDMSESLKCYVNEADVYRIHRMILQYQDNVLNTDTACPLAQVLRKLPAPPAERDDTTENSEICLRLINMFPVVEGERSLYVRRLLTKAKRLVVMVISIQTADNLLDLLESPSTEAHETKFQALLQNYYPHLFKARDKTSKSQHAGRKSTLVDSGTELNCQKLDSSRSTVHDGRAGFASDERIAVGSFLKELNSESCASLFVVGTNGVTTFIEFKRRVLEIMARLEDEGVITKDNNYQDILNYICRDTIVKRQQLKCWTKELDMLNKTLEVLEQKQVFLLEQKTYYQDYIKSCLSKRVGKSKSKRPSIFSKQYIHMKELQKSEKSIPQFGSYTYTAAELHKKGILVSIDYISPRNYNQILFTISSSQAGVFNIVGVFFGVTMPDTAQLRFDDLLARRYNNEDIIYIIDKVVININLFIYFLNKKFYT